MGPADEQKMCFVLFPCILHHTRHEKLEWSAQQPYSFSMIHPQLPVDHDQALSHLFKTQTCWHVNASKINKLNSCLFLSNNTVGLKVSAFLPLYNDCTAKTVDIVSVH